MTSVQAILSFTVSFDESGVVLKGGWLTFVCYLALSSVAFNILSFFCEFSVFIIM